MTNLSVYINLVKGLNYPVLLCLMWYFQRWENPTAVIYTVMQGTYGVLWILKSKLYPDRSFERPASIAMAYLVTMPCVSGHFIDCDHLHCGLLLCYSALAGYWLAGVFIMYYDVHASVWHQMLALSIYIFGIFLHFSSDIHKFVVLELRKGLITEGLWAYSRNINYFGELLIYGSFTSLARSWVPMAYLLLFICVYWLQNMRRKDNSLSRYKDFEQYKRSTRLFIPYIL